MRMRTALAATAAVALTVGLATTPPATATSAPAATVVSAATPAAINHVTESFGKALASRNLPSPFSQAELKHIAEVQDKLGLDTTYSDLLLDEIDPTGYVCPTGNSPVVDAIKLNTDPMSDRQFAVALIVLLLQVPFAGAAYLPQAPGPHTYGSTGKYTKDVTSTFRELQKFWDIPSRNIELVPAHGAQLLDPEFNYQVLHLLYGMDEAGARDLGKTITEEMNTPVMGYGKLPAWTFNAVASEGGDIPGLGQVPKRIAMGDGVLDGFKLVGLDDVAPEGILGHEFGHQVQFADGLERTDMTPPENGMWLELGADAFSGYFLTHPKGENMNRKHVQDFGNMFSQIGDCSFTDPSHHGTPNQRMKSALWGSGIAQDVKPRGRILPSLSFAKLFETHWPVLTAPDATD